MYFPVQHQLLIPQNIFRRRNEIRSRKYKLMKKLTLIKVQEKQNTVPCKERNLLLPKNHFKWWIT